MREFKWGEINKVAKKHVDEHFKFDDLVNSYKKLAGHYIIEAVDFYRKWEERTVEKVIFPSPEIKIYQYHQQKNFLDKIAYAHALKTIKETLAEEELKAFENGQLNIDCNEYLYCFCSVSNSFDYDENDFTLTLFEEDYVKQLFYLSMHLYRLSYLCADFKNTLYQFAKYNQKTPKEKYIFPYYSFQTYIQMWLVPTANYMRGKLGEKTKRTIASSLGGKATQEGAKQRKENAYNRVLEKGKIIGNIFEISKSDWQESCKDEDGLVPTYPTQKKYQIYFEQQLTEKARKEISIKKIKK